MKLPERVFLVTAYKISAFHPIAQTHLFFHLKWQLLQFIQKLSNGVISLKG